MNNTKRITLGEITVSIFDGKHGDCENMPGSGCYFISVKDLREYDIDYSEAREITPLDFAQNYIRTNLENGDTIYANTGDTIGKSLFVKNNSLVKKTSFQKSVATLKPDTKFVDPRYLYYLLKYETPRLRRAATGSGQKNLLLSTMRDFEVVIHDRKKQKNIVDVLGCVDDLIQNNIHICSELEAMAKTLHDYWFTQFDFPDDEGKPYRSSGGEMVWNEQLKREIPRGWEIGSVSTLLKIDNTSVDPLKLGSTIMEHYSIPAFDKDHSPTYEPACMIESGKYHVDKECILTSKLNPHFKRLWDPFCDTENAICSTEFIVYRPRKTWMRPFCYAVLNSDAFYAHMSSKAISSTGSRKRIQPDVSASFALAIPDDGTIRSFVAVYDPIMKKLKTLYKENRELQRLRDWLLPMLMNGQARVEKV